MNVSSRNAEGSRFVVEVMSRIRAMRKYLKVGRAEDLKEYYNENGTYKGIADWVSTRI